MLFALFNTNLLNCNLHTNKFPIKWSDRYIQGIWVSVIIWDTFLEGIQRDFVLSTGNVHNDRQAIYLPPNATVQTLIHNITCYIEYVAEFYWTNTLHVKENHDNHVN